MSSTWEVREGDALTRLREMPAESVQCCVTSPPYFGLRDYSAEGQIGLEATPDEFVAALVGVFREVRRVLRDDGTLWLNIGDSYNADGRKGRAAMGEGKNSGYSAWVNKTMAGTKPKDLLGIPWMVAFALRADDWYLRSDIIWAKPNPMPESVTDRPTSAHEHLFLLAKSPRYFYDADAIREPHRRDWSGSNGSTFAPGSTRTLETGQRTGHRRQEREMLPDPRGANRRNVWEIATRPYPEAHFATFPPKLVEPCVLAGTGADDVVLDPFAGSGTTGVVALRHGRSFIGIELNTAYCTLARHRICDDAPLLNTPAEVAA